MRLQGLGFEVQNPGCRDWWSLGFIPAAEFRVYTRRLSRR